MKNSFIIFIFMLLGMTLNAQDIITKRDGNVIMSKVLEVSKTEVKFKKFDNLEGPSYTEAIADLLSIRYEKSEKIEIFQKSPEAPVTESVKATPENLCDKGTQDAQVHYTGQNCGSGWVAGTTILLTPLVGVLTGGIISGEKPVTENLNAPQPSLLTNASYLGCYQTEAHKKKKKRVWRAFGTGSAVWCLLLLLV